MSKRRIGVEFLLALVLLIGAVLFFVSSSAWMASLALGQVPYSIDESLGEAASVQINATATRCNADAQAYVEELVAPLLAQVKDRTLTFHFAVVEDPTINAFALPGGYVFVNSGLIDKAETGEEIAGVLAHELSHVILRHGVERVLRDAGRRVLIGIVFGVSDVGVLLEYGGALRELAYGREQETEADEMGHELLKGAGISPLGMATFFERLHREGVQIPEILSTHPDSRARARSALAAGASFEPTLKLRSPEGVVCR